MNRFYEIVPEPENEYDPNAVAIYLHGKKIGHVKKGRCSRIKNLLKSEKFKGSDLEMHGGNYKKVRYDYDKDQEYVETVEHKGYSVILTIYLQEEPKKEEPKSEPVKPEIKEEPKKVGFLGRLFGKK